MSAIIKIR